MPTDVDKDKPDFQKESYIQNLPIWNKCRTVLAGSEAVKRAGQIYLPALPGKGAASYAGYLKRAVFFAGSKRTLESMLGGLTGVEPKVSYNDNAQAKAIIDSISVDQTSFKTVVRSITKEVLTTGRVGIFTSTNENADSYITYYPAESIINWRSKFVFSEDGGGEEKITLVTLKEEEYISGEFYESKIDILRVLKLLDGEYYQQKFYLNDENEWVSSPVELTVTGGEIISDGISLEQVRADRGEQKMLVRGLPVTEIPFIFLNADGMHADIADNPPLNDLVDMNLSHFKASAELENALHFSSVPTPIFTGISQEQFETIRFGPDEGILLPDNGAVVYLQLNATTLGPLSDSEKSKEAKMVILGSKSLEEGRTISESFENQSLRIKGENNILCSVADAVSDAMTKALRIALFWSNILSFDLSQVKVELNKEFAPLPPNPALLSELRELLALTLITREQFDSNLRKFGIISEEMMADNPEEQAQDSPTPSSQIEE